MALSTYTELKAAIADWLDRTDLTTQIVDFITLAEAELNRTLFIPEREEVSTATASAATLALPTDFWAMRALYLDTDPKTLLEQMSLSELRYVYSEQTTGQPQHFALQSGTEIVFGPAPDTSYDIIMNYYETIPSLSGVASNYILSAYPDLYLFGSLIHAKAFVSDDERYAMWRQRYNLAFEQAQDAGNFKAYGAAPLRIRAPQAV